MAIYVDNSATTAVDPQVFEAMRPYLNENYGNPSSLHELGHTANNAINEAREQVSQLLNCQNEEIYFASSGTMANNVALLGRARFAEANGLGKHLITTKIEHSAVLGPVEYLEASGWQVTYLPVDKEGFIEPSNLVKAINKSTSIISIAWANNEIGTIQPMAEIANIARQANIYLHSDAIQVPGKLNIDLNEIPISTLSISGHKFYGTKGIGVLFVRKDVNVMPICFGGGQENGLFAGTEAVANIVGIGKAAQLAKESLKTNALKLRQLQSMLIEKLSSLSNIKFTGPNDLSKRLPGHISLVVPGVSGETLILRSDLHGIYLSSGSACSNKVIEPSHVLRAIGLSDEEALGAVRISLGKFNDEEECDALGLALENIFRLEEPAYKMILGQH